MNTFLRSLLHWLRRSRHDADLREEIETHRALRQAALERNGLGADGAAWASQRAMGNVTLAVEEVRDVWASRAVDQLWQDIGIAVRGLRKNPGFTLVAIATLALGIGANTALFSIFNGLILRPLPVRDPGRLALLLDGSWSYPIWSEIKARENDLFDGAFAWANERFDLSRGGQSAFVDGAYVSGRFFEVLGVSAVRGRVLTPADDACRCAGWPRGRRQPSILARALCRRRRRDRTPGHGAAPGLHRRRRDAAGVLRRGRRADDGRDAAICRRAAHARSGKPVGLSRRVLARDDGEAEARAEPRAGECRAPRRAAADPRRDVERCGGSKSRRAISPVH